MMLSYSDVKSHIRNRQGYYLLLSCIALFFALITNLFQYQVINLSNNIDGSWIYTISSLRHSAQTLGSNIYYTYGPLFQRIPSYPLPGDGLRDFLIGLTLYLGLSIGLVYTLVRFIKLYKLQKNNKVLFGMVMFLAICFFVINTIDALFYLSLILVVFTAAKESDIRKLFIYLLLIALFSFYKVSFSIATVILVPVIFCINFGKYSLKKISFFTVTFYVLYIFLFSAITWASPLRVFDYLRYGFINAASYSEFMGLSVHENLKIVAVYCLLFLASLVLTLFLLLKSKEISIRNKVLLILPFFVCFLVLKQSIVRSDDHLLTFFVFIPILFTLPVFTYFESKKKSFSPRLSTIGVFIGVWIVLYLILLNTIFPADYNKVMYNRLLDKKLVGFILRNPIDYLSFARIKEKNTQNILKRRAYTAEVEEYLNRQHNSSLLFFGNTTSLGGILPGSNVMYMPFIQNYAAFPPRVFDSKYIQFARRYSDASILVEEVEPSINERIPSHELNDFFQFLRINYVVAYKDVGKKLFVLNARYRGTLNCNIISSTIQPKADLVQIPKESVHENEYLNMKILFKDNSLNRIIGALFKSPLYSITTIDKDGNIQTNRTTASTLEHGVVMRPLYYRFTDFVNDSKFTVEQARITGGLSRDENIKVIFEKCKYGE